MNKLHPTLLFSLLYAALALGIIYFMTSGGLGVSFDSENYLVMSERIILQDWERAFNPVWPALYPISIAAVEVVGSTEHVEAARIVSILSFVILAVCIFLLGLRLHGRFIAHLGVISMLSLAPLIYLYCHCWSETLYIMFSILFFLFLTIFLLKLPTENRERYLIGAAIFAGLGSITRYIGFSLIGTGVLSVLFFGSYHPPFRRFKKIILFALISLIPGLVHFTICFLNHGFVGKTQFPSKYTFWYQLSQLFSTMYHDLLSFNLNFWGYLFFLQWGFLAFWLRIFFFVGMLGLLAFFIRVLFLSKLAYMKFGPQTTILLYLVIYSSILLYVSSTVAIDPIGSRFTAPLYPLILLLIFSALSYIYRLIAQSNLKRVALIFTALCIISFWGIQVLSSLSIYKGISSGSFPAMEHPGNLNRKSLMLLKEEADSTDLIITNIPTKLSFIWPRQIDYPDISRDNWETFQGELIYESSKHSTYVLLCTEDYAPLGITLEDVEKTDKKYNVFSWSEYFDNDIIFKTKPVVFIAPPDSQKKE